MKSKSVSFCRLLLSLTRSSPSLKAWLLLILIFLGSAPVLAEDMPVFALKRGAPRCAKDCTVFTVDIYPDGKLHYRGGVVIHRKGKDYQYSKTDQDRYARLTPAQVEELIRIYDGLDWEEYARWYSKDGGSSDVGVAFITCTKCEHHERSNSLLFLRMMLQKINEFVNLEHWMCFPEGHKNREGCMFDRNYFKQKS
jgi:hypothetical protein